MTVDTRDDDVLRRYLLGRLTPEVREHVEQRLFSDDRIFLEHLCLVEAELINDYVDASLSADDVDQFERHFLCTAERRQKLEFARALRACAQEPAPNRPSWQRVSSSAWAVGLVAMLLIALPIGGWQFGARSQQADVSAWLSSGLTRDDRGELARVRVPPACKLVRLQLEKVDDSYQSHGAAVYAPDGGEIWSQAKLNVVTIDGRAAFMLTLPSELLPVGDYYVRLRGSSPDRAATELSRYDFRVLRE
jgi:hypothetical protein